jgi:hypothetical protein
MRQPGPFPSFETFTEVQTIPQELSETVRSEGSHTRDPAKSSDITSNLFFTVSHTLPFSKGKFVPVLN